MWFFSVRLLVRSLYEITHMLLFVFFFFFFFSTPALIYDSQKLGYLNNTLGWKRYSPHPGDNDASEQLSCSSNCKGDCLDQTAVAPLA